MTVQMSMLLQPKKSMFHIQEQDFFKYDPPSAERTMLNISVTLTTSTPSGYATSLVHALSEMLFEQHCEP